MAEIRRNADGNQSLIDLRGELSTTKHAAYRQGGKWIGNWIARKWSDGHNAYIEHPMPYYFDERMTIQWILFGAPETEDEVSYHASRSKNR